MNWFLQHTSIKYILFFFFILSFTACKKENKEAITGTAKLRIAVSGVSTPSNERTPLNLRSASGKSASVNKGDVGAHLKAKMKHNGRSAMLNRDAFSAFTYTENDYSSAVQHIDPKSSIQRSFKMASSKQKRSSATVRSGELLEMEAKIKYRFVLFSGTGKSRVVDRDFELEAGTPISIDVVKGQEYSWVAYSFNTDEGIPALNVHEPTVETFTDKSLLHASGSFNTNNAGDYDLPILFAHKLMRFGLRLDSRGIFAKINDAKATYVGPKDLVFSSGKFDVFTGKVTEVLSTNATRLTMGSSIPLAAIDEEEQIYAAYYYTVDPAALPADFEVDVNYISVRFTDSDPKQEFDKVLITSANVERLNFGGFSPALGKASTGALGFAHSGTEIGGLRWASGNLYYEDEQYRFRPSDVYNYFDFASAENTNTLVKKYTQTDFWYWMSETPSSPRSLVPSENRAWLENQVDPCMKVYPEGLWRVPTKADFDILLNRAIASSSVSGTATNRVVAFHKVSENQDNPSTNYFRFKADGRWQPSANFGDPDNETGRLTYDNLVLLWSSHINPSNMANNGSIAFYFRNSGSTVQLVNGVSTNLISRRYNIRCVRDN